MEANAAAAGISVTVTSMMMSGFTAFLPTLKEVRRASKDDTTIVNDVRYGQFAAGVMAVGIGALMAYLSQSSTPLYVAFFTTFLFAAIYELALRNNGA